jgi:hypothetical protein
VQDRVQQLLLDDRAQMGAFVNEATAAGGPGSLGLGYSGGLGGGAGALAEVETLLLRGDRQVRHGHEPVCMCVCVCVCVCARV